MANEKQLRKAAAELNEVMGLEPPINVKASVAVLTEGIVEAISNVDPDDEFSDVTQAVIDELTPPKKGKKGKPAPVEDVEEEDVDEDEEEETEEEEEEEEKPAPKKKGTLAPTKKGKKVIVVEDEEEEDETEEDDEEEEAAPKDKKKRAGGPPKGVKPSFKTDGSMAQFMDKTVQKGGDWDEIFETISKEAKKRGVKTTMSTVKAHAKFRVSKDPKFLGKLKITADGIE